MDEGRNMILLFPTLIKFKNEEERKKFEPRLAKSPSIVTASENMMGNKEGGRKAKKKSTQRGSISET